MLEPETILANNRSDDLLVSSLGAPGTEQGAVQTASELAILQSTTPERAQPSEQQERSQELPAEKPAEVREQHSQPGSPTKRRGSDLGSGQAAQAHSAEHPEASPASTNSDAVAGLQTTASTQSSQVDRQRQQPPGSPNIERTTADIMPAAQQPAQAAASGLATSAAHVGDRGLIQQNEMDRPTPQQQAGRSGQKEAARSAPIREANSGTAGKHLPLAGALQQTDLTPQQPHTEGISALTANLQHQLPAVDPAVQSQWSGYQPQLLPHVPGTAAGQSQQTWHTTASFPAGLSASPGERGFCLLSCHDCALHSKDLTANIVQCTMMQCRHVHQLAMGSLLIADV